MSDFDVSDENFDMILNDSTTAVLVDVWAPWCGPCKMVGPAVKRIHEQQQGRFRLAMANMEKFSASAEKYGIKTTPTLILFKDGKEVSRRSGAMMESQIKQWLDLHIEPAVEND